MKKLIAVLLLSLPSALPAQSNTLGWIPIGGKFGSNQSWQFGFDSGATAGGCVQREVHDGQWLAGPCRDIFLLKKNGVAHAHTGGAVLYNAERGNATYSLRAGINVGPVASALLNKAVDRLPYLEGLADIKVPKFLGYIGDITTIDYAVGYRPIHSADVIGNWTHGPMVKMDIPLTDIYHLLKSGL